MFPKPLIPDYFPEKGYKKILNSVCVKTNPIRKSEYYIHYSHVIHYCSTTGIILQLCVLWVLIPSNGSNVYFGSSLDMVNFQRVCQFLLNFAQFCQSMVQSCENRAFIIVTADVDEYGICNFEISEMSYIQLFKLHIFVLTK